MDAPERLRPRGAGRARRGVLAHLAGAPGDRAAAGARAAGDRARLLGRAVAERDLGVPGCAARDGQDPDAQRALAARRPARGGVAMSDRFDELVGEIEDPARAGAAAARPQAAALGRRSARVCPPVRADARRRRSSCCRGGGAVRAGAGRSRARGRGVRRRLARRCTQRRRRGGTRDPDGGRQRRPRRLRVDRAPAAGREENGNWPMVVRVRGLDAEHGPSGLLRALADEGRQARRVLRALHGRTGLTTVTLSVPYGLRRYDDWVDHAPRLGRDPAHDLDRAAGCQSSKRFPSGSTAQPKRPNSCSSTLSSTSAPAARSWASMASRSRTR